MGNSAPRLHAPRSRSKNTLHLVADCHWQLGRARSASSPQAGTVALVGASVARGPTAFDRCPAAGSSHWRPVEKNSATRPTRQLGFTHIFIVGSDVFARRARPAFF